MLKPGTYRLTKNVENPKPDRRVKEDWRCHPVWPKGTEFLVEPVNYKERDDEPTSMWTRIIKVGHKWKHENLTANDGPQYQAIEAAIEECPVSDAAFFTTHDIRDYFAQWLILSKRLTRELFLKLHAEFESDGELNSRDPHPERVSLVEPEVKKISRYRISVSTPGVRGGYVYRELTGTAHEAFEIAASEIKNGSTLVFVHENDKQIAELRMEPKDLVTAVEESEHDQYDRATGDYGRPIHHTRRFVGEIVALTCDCELGHLGERATVTVIDGIYMTLTFFDREPARRKVSTGADYAYLRSV